MKQKFIVKEEFGIPFANCPISGGVPFSPGSVPDISKLTLTDEAGAVMEADIEATSFWHNDGSVKTCRVSFCSGLSDMKNTVFYLTDQLPMEKAREKMQIDIQQDTVIVKTSRLRVCIPLKGYKVFEKVYLDDELIIDNKAARGFLVVDKNGKIYDSALHSKVELTVEENGTARSVIRVIGRHIAEDGTSLFSFMCRYFFYFDSEDLRIDYTFMNDEEADSIFLSELSYEVEAVNTMTPTAGYFGYSSENPQNAFSLEIYKCEDETILTGQSADLIYDGVEMKKKAFFENRLQGILSLDDGKRGFGTTVYRIAQNQPKALRYDGERKLKTDLWFGRNGETLEFMQGMSKTHRLLFTFFNGDAKQADAHRHMNGMLYPPVMHADEAYLTTGFCGRFLQYSPKKYRKYEIYLRDIFHMWKAQNRPFGMVDYGDFPQLAGNGREDYMGNNEHDLPHGLFLQYYRTGERDYFYHGEDTVMHMLDIDYVCHSKYPDETGGVREHGPNHGANFTNGAYTNPSHMWLEGIVDYYYLTGDKVVLEKAGNIARHLMTYEDECLSMPPERTIAWSVIALISYYEATGDNEVFDYCGKLVDYMIKYIENNPFLYCNFGYRKSVAFFHIGLVNEAIYRYMGHIDDSEQINRIRAAIIKNMNSLYDHGMFDEGTFMYVDYPEYRMNQANWLLLEPFGYAYDVTGKPHYIEDSIDNIDRCHEIVNLLIQGGNVNRKGQLTLSLGHLLAISLRSSLRFMYYADKSGKGRDMRWP